MAAESGKMPPVGAPVPSVPMPDHGRETVTVASKLPFPLLLEIECDTGQKTLSGEKVYAKTEYNGIEAIEINGTAKKSSDNVSPANPIVAGYALTYDVPKDFWEMWLSQHKNAPFVKKGFVFAHANTKDIHAHAKEMEKERTNLEPMMQEGDPRAPVEKVPVGG